MAPLMQAVAILEPLDKKYPDHPGITHYLIHSYDFAPIAQGGIPAANKYARIAPAAPHAQHMPSHIYSMVGMWQPSIESNLASVKVANEYAAQSKLDGVLAGVPHAYDFMEYAYLQLGQDAKAKALIEESATIKKVVGADKPATSGDKRSKRSEPTTGRSRHGAQRAAAEPARPAAKRSPRAGKRSPHTAKRTTARSAIARRTRSATR